MSGWVVSPPLPRVPRLANVWFPAVQIRVLWHYGPSAPALVVLFVVWFPVLYLVAWCFGQYTSPEDSGAVAYPARLLWHLHVSD